MSRFHKSDRIRNKAIACVGGIAALAVLLTAVTYALIVSFLTVDGSLFETARLEIELNNGQVIFNGTEIDLEPGRFIQKSFPVENKSTVDVYYRLYLENITGSLQEVLVFQIYDGDRLLFSGGADDCSKDHPCRDGNPLAAGETRELTAVMKMREDANRGYQNGFISFDITAEAVQARNNPDQTFLQQTGCGGVYR